jgi:hypothetical protein
MKADELKKYELFLRTNVIQVPVQVSTLIFKGAATSRAKSSWGY